ncbi:MAG: ATP phosphoribosyltransferase [Roseiflexaceae bacterium]|nr:ATP phosphoribosyltransferase [Roseiflexaceae bacterium]
MKLRFALPSKGMMYDSAAAFLESCNLKVSRPNPRRYTAGIHTLPQADVLLHRPADIVEKVADGEIDLGITGLDLVEEQRGDRDDLLVIYDDLGFGRAELVVAVPDTWIDVSSWRDLADLSVELQAQGRPLRIATKYHELIRRFCYANGINYFQLVDSQGATEAAPGLSYADIIADITETGTTLRDNQLKIVGGPILRSQACVVANRANLRADSEKREAVKLVLELVEARQRGRQFVSVVANVPGASAEDVGRRVAARRELAGMQGPTVAPVWTPDGASFEWHTVTVVVRQDRVMAAVDHLRTLGGDGITVTTAQYVFTAHSEAYQRLLAALEQ